MEPLNPNDPLWKLLGQSRPVEPRSNFAQNVLREARNTAQETGWWPQLQSALRDWLTVDTRRPLLAGAAAVVLAAMTAVWLVPSAPVAEVAASKAAVSAQALADEDMALIANSTDTPLEALNHVDALVALTDTSSLSDKEIAFLLY